MPQYNDEEWTTLLFAPLWVFEAVAGVDDDIDNAELEALVAAIRGSAVFNCDLSQEVFTELADDFDTIIFDYDDDDADVVEGLVDTAELLADKEAADTALEFKKDMIELALIVAEASGGSRFRSGISAEERTALAHVAKALQMEQAAFMDVIDIYHGL